MDNQLSRPSTRNGFEIAIFCALALEADAVVALFGQYWDNNDTLYDKAPGDHNSYSTGSIGRHNVVLVHLSGMGKVSSAIHAAHCKLSFPNIKLGLLVGIAGIVPFGAHSEEIILGDVIISEGIIQQDFGRQLPEGFVPKQGVLDLPGRPNTEVRATLAKLKSLRSQNALRESMAKHLDNIRLKPELDAEYPGMDQDKLFAATYRHKNDKQTCDQCGCDDQLIPRQRLQTASSPSPAAHFGMIACSDSIMRSGEDRDAIASKEHILAFEMESAGIWDIFPCIVIKGGCDYADSHKNKRWQRYAAATAASCMKAFLESYIPSSRSNIHPQNPDQELQARRIQELHSTAEQMQRGTQGLHKSMLKAEQKLRFNQPRIDDGSHLSLHCYRCDYTSHLLAHCYAKEDTVKKARKNRWHEDRCINCGEDDHYQDSCSWANLLRRRY